MSSEIELQKFVALMLDVILLDGCTLFHHCPFLLPHGEDVQKILEQWKEYKMGVPTFGAIMLDEALENVGLFSHTHDSLLKPLGHIFY